MWGMFALGLFIGIVGATTALLAFVVVESVETGTCRGVLSGRSCEAKPEAGGEDGKDSKIMKDCFRKPTKVVTTCDIRPGDFIHDIYDSASLLDIEKRKGFVASIASKIESKRIVLRLIGRRTSLEVPANNPAVITATGG